MLRIQSGLLLPDGLPRLPKGEHERHAAVGGSWPAKAWGGSSPYLARFGTSLRGMPTQRRPGAARRSGVAGRDAASWEVLDMVQFESVKSVVLARSGRCIWPWRCSFLHVPEVGQARSTEAAPAMPLGP